MSMKMSIPSGFSPVGIEIEDPKRFGYVAFLVDREDFITDLLFLRRKWKLDKKLLVRDSNSWRNYFLSLASEKQKASYEKKIQPFERKGFDLNYVRGLDNEARQQFFEEYDKTERILPLNQFEFEIKVLCKKYKRTPNFAEIIACAVVYGSVRDEDYTVTEVSLVYPEVDIPGHFQEDPELKIKFYPTVTPQEIIKVFQEKAPALIKEYEQKYIGGNVFDYDIKPSIKIHRKWYWQKKELSWKKLFIKIVDEEKQTISLEGIRSAVKEYQNRLAV